MFLFLGLALTSPTRHHPSRRIECRAKRRTRSWSWRPEKRPQTRYLSLVSVSLRQFLSLDRKVMLTACAEPTKAGRRSKVTTVADQRCVIRVGPITPLQLERTSVARLRLKINGIHLSHPTFIPNSKWTAGMQGHQAPIETCHGREGKKRN